ncbi:MAG: NTF2-like N-terminal transpeptidase domain-containing protein, partial [Mycobacterium sp.]
MTTLISRVTGLSAVLVTVLAVQACTPRPDGPGPAADRFFAALATGDTAAAAELTDDPSAAREALNAAWAGLQATHLDARILGAKYTEDTGLVDYRFAWQLPK